MNEVCVDHVIGHLQLHNKRKILLYSVNTHYMEFQEEQKKVQDIEFYINNILVKLKFQEVLNLVLINGKNQDNIIQHNKNLLYINLITVSNTPFINSSYFKPLFK